MGLKKIVTSCIGLGIPKDRQEDYPALVQGQEIATPNVYSGSGQVSQKIEFSNYYELIKKIQKGEITLEVLHALKELKKEDKKSFLEAVEYIIPNDVLHELNTKIMGYAKDLTDSEDPAFLLRGSNNGIFRDLFYLEAKNNKCKISIDNEKTLTFDLPSWLLELYQSLIVNFYEKNFENKEFQKTYYDKCYSWSITPFEKLSDERKEVIKEHYIKKSLTQSIMFLFISNIFKQDIVKNADVSELSSLGNLEKELNNPKSIYIKNLETLDILSHLGYSAYNEILPLESIEISGNYDFQATILKF